MKEVSRRRKPPPSPKTQPAADLPDIDSGACASPAPQPPLSALPSLSAPAKCATCCDLHPLMERILASIETPERALELYYWSREPELAAVMRVLVALPATRLAELAAFFDVVNDPPSITAEIDAHGRFVLSSPRIADAMASQPGQETAPDTALEPPQLH